MIRKIVMSTVAALALTACASVKETEETTMAKANETVAAVEAETADVVDAMDEKVEMAKQMAAPMALKDVLAAQSEENKARYAARRPAETLEFFGVESGMTVVEALPGGGWYTKILLPYLGGEGKLIGGNYPDDIWTRLGLGEEFAESRRQRSAAFVETASEWNVEGGPALDKTTLTDMANLEDGSVDAVLFIRAMHNLNRFNAEAQYASKTTAEALRVLKPGGIVGVVQHRAPESNPDEWANGSAGYLKESHVTKLFTDAGFVLEASSELNANAKDMPTTDDIVWRLPPSFFGMKEDSPERAANQAIGESDRMTLRFRKPS